MYNVSCGPTWPLPLCKGDHCCVVSAVRGGEVMTGVTGMAPSILVSTFQLWLGAGNNDRQ